MSSTPSSSLPQTFQLPDTLSIIAPLELSANAHCRAASDASASFISKIGLPDLNSLFFPPQEDKEGGKGKDEDDQEDKLKLGLLTSLVFPRADLPQLVLLTDFVQLLVWSCIVGSVNNIRNGTLDATGQNMGHAGLGILEEHPYFKHLIPRLKRYPRSSSSEWKKSFEASFRGFCEAQQLVHSINSDEPNGKMKKWVDARNQPSKPRFGGVDTSRKTNPITGRGDELDVHLKFRRNMYGVDMIVGIAELAELMPAFDELGEDLMKGGEYELQRCNGTLLSPAEMNLVRNAKEYAVDFMGMAIDALSFRYLQLSNLPSTHSNNAGSKEAVTPPTPPSTTSAQESNSTTTNINPYLPHTFIPHIMMHNHLSLQGAMNHSVSLLTAEFDRFRDLSEEKKVSELVERESERVSRLKAGGGMWAIGGTVMSMMKLLGGSTSGDNLRGEGGLYVDNGEGGASGEGALYQHYLSSEARRHRKAQLKAHAHVLEDLIVGCVNWAYESELLFGGGNKGAEVRAFGWVFG